MWGKRVRVFSTGGPSCTPGRKPAFRPGPCGPGSGLHPPWTRRLVGARAAQAAGKPGHRHSSAFLVRFLRLLFTVDAFAERRLRAHLLSPSTRISSVTSPGPRSPGEGRCAGQRAAPCASCPRGTVVSCSRGHRAAPAPGSDAEPPPSSGRHPESLPLGADFPKRMGRPGLRPRRTLPNRLCARLRLPSRSAGTEAPRGGGRGQFVPPPCAHRR